MTLSEGFKTKSTISALCIDFLIHILTLRNGYFIQRVNYSVIGQGVGFILPILLFIDSEFRKSNSVMLYYIQELLSLYINANQLAKMAFWKFHSIQTTTFPSTGDK